MAEELEKKYYSTHVALNALCGVIDEKIKEGGEVSVDFLQNVKNRLVDIIHGDFDPNTPFGWDFSEYMTEELFEGFTEIPLTTPVAEVRAYLDEYYRYLERSGINSSAIEAPPRGITGKKKLLEVLSKQGIYTYGELLSTCVNREEWLIGMPGVGRNNVTEINHMFCRILGMKFVEDLKEKKWKIK